MVVNGKRLTKHKKRDRTWLMLILRIVVDNACEYIVRANLMGKYFENRCLKKMNHVRIFF